MYLCMYRACPFARPNRVSQEDAAGSRSVEQQSADDDARVKIPTVLDRVYVEAENKTPMLRDSHKPFISAHRLVDTIWRRTFEAT